MMIFKYGIVEDKKNYGVKFSETKKMLSTGLIG